MTILVGGEELKVVEALRQLCGSPTNKVSITNCVQAHFGWGLGGL